MSGTLRPLAALALVAVIGAGCGSNAPSETGTAGKPAGGDKKATDQDKAVKFAECIRAHGVPDFPDPDAKGDFDLRDRREPRACGRRPSTRARTCSHRAP